MTRRDLLATGAAGILTTAAVSEASAAPPPESRWRVYDTTADRSVSWKQMASRLSAADVVFAGEFHDDPQTHRAELALLETLAGSWKQSLTLALEMLERDSQPALDSYLAGTIDEATFAKTARLWPNYATDYRPMVEFARARKIPVLASNAPGPVVKRVGKEGIAKVLATLTDAEKPLIAATVSTPTSDAYEKRFADVMGGAGAHGSDSMEPAMVRRFYEAQCVRDDTMAETITTTLNGGRKVLHINGSFHSDAGLGTAQRVLWRRPLRTSIAVVKFVPVKGDVAKADATPFRAEAQFVVFVPDERPAEKA